MNGRGAGRMLPRDVDTLGSRILVMGDALITVQNAAATAEPGRKRGIGWQYMPP